MVEAGFPGIRTQTRGSRPKWEDAADSALTAALIYLHCSSPPPPFPFTFPCLTILPPHPVLPPSRPALSLGHPGASRRRQSTRTEAQRPALSPSVDDAGADPNARRWTVQNCACAKRGVGGEEERGLWEEGGKMPSISLLIVNLNGSNLPPSSKQMNEYQHFSFCSNILRLFYDEFNVTLLQAIYFTVDHKPHGWTAR